MIEFDELYKAMRMIKGDVSELSEPGIPLFSFEGLPGAGKTTQIRLVAEQLERVYGKIVYIDLPTSSSVGQMMRALYSDLETWKRLRKQMPWLNVLAMSVDLRLAVQEAIKSGAKYAIMSRGILSTYYYNLDAYGDIYSDASWDQMTNDMKAFFSPTAIIFLDLPETVAHKRVVKRNRGPLREMDDVNNMKRDKKLLEDYLKRLGSIPVHYVNANAPKNEVTYSIMQFLREIIEKDV